MIDFLITASDMPDSVPEMERAKVGRKGGFLLGQDRAALLKAIADGLDVETAKVSPEFDVLVAMKLLVTDGKITSYGLAIASKTPYVAISAQEPAPMPEAQMLERIKLLSDEMDANEEENRAMQAEIDALYVKIDAAKAIPN